MERQINYSAKKQKLAIGIDIGTYTGLAIWNCNKKSFEFIETMPIHQALNKVFNVAIDADVKVYLENVKKIGGNIQAAQGAGSIKRDLSIWCDALNEWAIEFVLIRPSKSRSPLFKCTAEFFKLQTGWDKRTSQHARDAAALVYQL